MKEKRKILIIMGRYLPGYKDGGPVRSIKNLVDYLGDEYEFRILTCDRDHGDTQPYPNIRVNGWNPVEKTMVYYVSPHGFTKTLIKKLSNEVDLVYVCGCFNDYAINTLILKRFNIIRKPVVVAAMGLFSPMAFQIKYKKKKVFTSIFNWFGLFKNIYWSATSKMEVHEICQQIKAVPNQFYIAEDLPRMVDPTPIVKEKQVDQLSVCWISRIVPKKNLMQAIEILSGMKSKVDFAIYGPAEDAEYRKECQSKLEHLPNNVSWHYKGIVESECVVDTLKQHHVFLFPTLGENYGHVIQEALSAGCPCILSNQTPWQDLEKKGVGYVYKLDELQKFVNALESYAAMDQKAFNDCVQAAHQYAIKNSNEKAKSTGYRKIFDTL